MLFRSQYSLFPSHDTICEDKFGESPFHRMAGPQYVHKMVLKSVTKSMVLPKDNFERTAVVHDYAVNSKWCALVNNEYWFARKALRGGRTDVRKIYHVLTDEDIAQGKKIKYVDIVSMYPSVQVSKPYPVGRPTIHIYDEDYYPCRDCSHPQTGNNGAITCVCEGRLRSLLERSEVS